MIDNSISDLRKQFWINLEFYFKSYEFYNFLEFFGIFSFLIYAFNNINFYHAGLCAFICIRR